MSHLQVLSFLFSLGWQRRLRGPNSSLSVLVCVKRRRAVFLKKLNFLQLAHSCILPNPLNLKRDSDLNLCAVTSAIWYFRWPWRNRIWVREPLRNFKLSDHMRHWNSTHWYISEASSRSEQIRLAPHDKWVVSLPNDLYTRRSDAHRYKTVSTQIHRYKTVCTQIHRYKRLPTR